MFIRSKAGLPVVTLLRSTIKTTRSTELNQEQEKNMHKKLQSSFEEKPTLEQSLQSWMYSKLEAGTRKPKQNLYTILWPWT